MIPGWLSEARDRFWAEAGPPPPFPRDLMLPALRALVIDPQVLPGLRLSGIEDWFGRRSCRIAFGQQDRRLRGCLSAIGRCAIIFVDGGDDAAERRFTFAHELAHFLVDYLLPRNRTIALMGESIAEVLDGLREPTEQEQIGGALNDCQLGFYRHLLERRSSNGHISHVESRADQLAWELLAPDEEVSLRFGAESLSVAELSQGLVNEFGLPAPEATKYARRWIRVHQGPEPLIRLV